MKTPNLGSLPIGLGNPSEIVGTQDLTLLCAFLGHGTLDKSSPPPLCAVVSSSALDYLSVVLSVSLSLTSEWVEGIGLLGVLASCRQNNPVA